jgi:hypothetical protein
MSVPEPVPVERITLPCPNVEAVAGETAALYVMVMAHGREAKIGAVEKAQRAAERLREVDAALVKRGREAACFPVGLAVVAELDGLVVGPPADPQSTQRIRYYERWALVEHLESALRLAFARRLGSLSAATNWIHLDRPLTIGEWVEEVEAAWTAVCCLLDQSRS